MSVWRANDLVVRLWWRVAEGLVALQFAGFLLAGFLWAWGMPHGFPWGHPRFLANGLLPLVIVFVTAFGCAGLVRNRPRWLALGQVFLSAGCVVAALLSWYLFPISFRGLFGLIAGFVAGGSMGLTLAFGRRMQAASAKALAAAVVLGAATGGLFVVAQKAAPAATVPAGKWEPLLTDAERFRLDSLFPDLEFRAASAEVSIRHGDVLFQIEPLLDFESISPDRFWTLFSPLRPGFRHCVMSGQEGGAFHAAYQGDARAELFARRVADRVWEIAAQTQLKQDVYSHLNSYCVVHAQGLRRPSLRFGGGAVVDVLPSDYPVGRPARFAFLTDGDGLAVMEARTGEKGPFRLLTEATLAADQSLTLTLFDGEEAHYDITFRDFARHASRQLSPTAGWDVRENAIEFWLADDTALIIFTLAGTSVGRGWDSVGHAAGTYRNRIRIEALRPPTAKP